MRKHIEIWGWIEEKHFLILPTLAIKEDSNTGKQFMYIAWATIRVGITTGQHRSTHH